MIDALPPIITCKVVFQAMEDTGKVLGLRSVTEGHQLEQDIKRQWGYWQRRPPFDRNGNSVGHDVAEAGHVQDETFFEFQPISRDRSAERKDVHPTPVAMLQADAAGVCA